MSTDKATKSNSDMTQKEVWKFVDSHFVDVMWEDYFTEVGYTKLKASLGKTAKGQPKVYTAPFAREGDREIPMEQVLSEWNETLVSIADKWPTLLEFENDLAKKVGPMSVELPIRERLADIAHYYLDILLPRKPIDQRAIKAVQKEFAGLRGLHRRSLQDTFNNMKKSSSAGNPTMGKRRDYGQDQVTSEVYHTIEDVIADYPTGIKSLDGKGYYFLVAIVGWRGQEGGPKEEDVKQRVIWMFPFVANLHELSVYQPLIEGVQKLDLVPAWVSMDSVDMHITALFDTKGADDLVVCTDFSKFDQHFNDVMQEAAKSILADILYNNASSRKWLNEVFPIKYMIPLAWELCGKNVCGDVSLFRGKHGMASGSGGTNADETLAHRALQYEAAILHNSRLNPHSMCLGDDGILSYPGITVDDVVEVYESHGQECNRTKQYASSQDCVYLRRWHHKDYRENGVCVGVYSTNRALGKLRYLERYMDPEFWSDKMVALRQLSIIENCNHHPLFEEFVEFCMKRDRYRLGIDIPGFLDNIDDYAEKAIDYMPDFLGYVKTLQGTDTSLSNWRVVKYLKSKA
nr:MAG: putative RNA-dependent RNA polymerase [Picobirnavirus sp.]